MPPSAWRSAKTRLRNYRWKAATSPTYSRCSLELRIQASLTRPAGVKRFFHLFCLCESLGSSLLISIGHTHALAQERSFPGRILFRRRSSIAIRVPLRAQPRVPSSLRYCPPNISSVLTDHDEVFELPGYPGRAGRLINRPVTVHTIPDFKHLRTGCTALLLLSATTELLVINLVPQHDPQADSELACHRHTRLPQTFLHQFAAVETLQLRIATHRMSTRFTPQEAQQRTALFGHSTESLSLSAGVFPRNEPHITAQGLAVCEALRIPQENVGGQRPHRPHSGVGHQQSGSATLLGLLRDLPGQVFDFLFHLPVHLLQHTPSIRSMGHQRQEGDLRLPVVAPQTRTAS